MVLAVITVFLCHDLHAEDIRTNEFVIKHAPKWLKKAKVEKITDSIQSKLEWSTRRIPMIWHETEESFSRAHSLRPLPAAVTIKSPKKVAIHLGPQVTAKNYQAIIGHELVHVIFYQKYRGAIPQWLEEGFANHLARKKPVNYQWLSKQKIPRDVTLMGHPYKAAPSQLILHYKVSQALVEMLKKKCDLSNLLRLSVERKMADYIKTYCNISDINASFKKWIKKKAKP